MDDKVQELVDAIPEWFIGEKDEQTVEFAEWLIEEMNVTDGSKVSEWSEEDWIEAKGIDPAKVSNDEGLEKQLRGEFHVVWLARKTE